MFDTYADIFKKRAREYHHAMKASPRARDREFEAVLEPLRAARPGLVCDMPSGGGYLAPYLWPDMEYLAVDPATDFFVEWPTPLRRVVAEITDVPLADGSVDHVVSLAGLHHEPSLPRVFGEMRRLIRRGGRAVVERRHHLDRLTNRCCDDLSFSTRIDDGEAVGLASGTLQIHFADTLEECTLFLLEAIDRPRCCVSVTGACRTHIQIHIEQDRKIRPK